MWWRSFQCGFDLPQGRFGERSVFGARGQTQQGNALTAGT